MRLERISAHEIKAYLSQQDLNELGIKDSASLDGGAAEIILGVARAELDFCCEKNNCEIFMQSCKDGCTLTLKSPDNKKKKFMHKSVLCFDEYGALYIACIYLNNFKIRYSELRKEDDKTYYLVIEYDDETDQLDGKPYWLSSVSELCSSVHTDKNAFFYYICEHSIPVIEKNAVYHIAKSEKKW